MDDNNLKKLETIWEFLSEDKPTRDEIKSSLKMIFDWFTSVKDTMYARMDTSDKTIETQKKDLFVSLTKTEDKLSKEIDALKKSKKVDELAIEFNKIQAIVSALSTTVDGLPDLSDLIDIEAQLKKVEKKIPSVMSVKEMRDALEILRNDERLDVSAIKGIEKYIEKIQGTGKAATIWGGSRGLYTYIDGVKKGLISMVNLVAGTGVSLAYSLVNGMPTITINASGGGGSGVTVETPPETPDSIITVFTVTAEPKWVVADGTTYYDGEGYTYNSLQVTMDFAPSKSIRVII